VLKHRDLHAGNKFPDYHISISLSKSKNMKTTPLTEIHRALGAKMVEFGGYEMPVSYKSIKEEHHCVRTNVGVFDVSHMGEFVVRGKEALDLIQQITTNDASTLEIGEAQYACMPNFNGGIVDDLLVYRLPESYCSEGEKAFLLVVNASNMEKDWNWIELNNVYDTQVINISERTGLLAIQGPNAAKVLQLLTAIDLSAMKYYTFEKGVFAGCENVIISATGYTGAGGFEIYANNKDMQHIWAAIFEAGKPFDIQPIGLGARDTLRLEMGYTLYGNDIDDHTSPLEAGLGWVTKLNKADFNSYGIFKKQKEEGVSKKLVAFELNDRRVPRHGYAIHSETGEFIGTVTSGTQSPSLDKPIGMGYVNPAFSKAGTVFSVMISNKPHTAVVVKTPFVKPTV
jgi:aminomethyltransferase